MPSDRKAELEKNNLRHSELTKKFWVSEWTLDIQTASMLYLYGRTDQGSFETQCGMGVGQGDTTLYIWPNRDTGQMCLSASSGSMVFWDSKYGKHFNPVYVADKLVVGNRICLMKGNGPSKGKSLWVKIVPHQNVKNLKMDYFLGTWKSSICEGTIINKEDGTWQAYGDDGNLRMSGTWSIKGNRLIDTFDHMSENFKEVMPILSANENEYMLQEMDGSITTFTRIKN
jgi:hypothetical protein